MKYFVTFLIAITSANAYSQCSVGGNGLSVSSVITVDGNISDWSAVLADPDNYTNDAVPDMDAPIADVGRNFTRFAFTESYTNLYILFSRAGSANNAVDALLYLDVNNNGVMETNEPVIAISWSGANGNGKVDIYNYVQANAGGDVITGDGVDMPGSLLLRNTLGVIGKGTSDGQSLEVAIPFSQLYKQGSTSSADMLVGNDPFKFHLSTINGSPTSVPGPNAINDNFDGCYSGLMILPLNLEYFEAKAKDNHVYLSWEVSDNEEAVSFEIEVSADGKIYETAGTVYATKDDGQEQYSYNDDKKTEGNRYYRLKMIDINGTVLYSKVITVTLNVSLLNLKIANPVYADVAMTFESLNKQQCSIRMFNVAGVQVYSRSLAIETGSNRISIPAEYLKSNGAYILEFTDALKNRSTHKVIKM